MASSLDPRQREIIGRQDRLQAARARCYLLLSSLTATLPFDCFIEVLRDVAETNARGQVCGDREAWERLAAALRGRVI